MPDIKELLGWANRAGELLRQGYEKPHQVSHKGRIDLVTEMDHASEALILSAIQEKYPQDMIVTEESGLHQGDHQRCWYIDPLDGTVNYAHGVPFFCVSIGYAEDGVVKMGVVYEPLRNEAFWAIRGQGAWRNDQPLHCSQPTELDQALLVTGFPYDIQTNPHNNLDLFSFFALRCQGLRRLGSAALDLCYVAAGRLDGYWEGVLQTYDLAAGSVIAEEAGAKVTHLDGSTDILKRPCTILAANPALHAKMLAGVQSLLK
ncbi:MAG TPA: inositol monophosphatase family protein [Longilinea sp.]|nr:inositol monophosphatase family protein [Longilinea sp.]